ncbi:MAG: ABC transporter permease [Acidobacteriota bacterium]
MIRKSDRPDDDFAAEVESHLEIEADEIAERESISRQEAMLRARRNFGNVGRTRERFYESNRRMWLDHLWRDLRFAVRQMRKSPLSTSTVVVSLALGIGACATVFSVLGPFMVRDLPFEEPERLVWVANSLGDGGSMSMVTSRTSNLRDFRELNKSFDGLTGYNAFFEHGSYNLVGESEPIRLVGVSVAHDFLDVLGVTPHLGRGFTAEEGDIGDLNAVVLSHGFWTRRFGADPTVVGSTINLAERQTKVIGVLPASFDFASIFSPRTRVDFLHPWPIDERTDRYGNTLSMIGRLKPGVTVEQAQADVDTMVAALEQQDPERWGLGGHVTTLQESVTGPFRSALLLLAGAAAMVMLIVCVNVTNLLLSRGPRRSSEMAVRSALGAPRGRLVRQLLIESLVVSLLGALGGSVLAFGATQFVANATGLGIPLLESVTVNNQVLLFATALAVLVALVVGTVPALQITQKGHATALQDLRRRGSSAGSASVRWREVLVVAEIALACILVVTGGLLLRSFQNVLDTDLGFQADEVAVWRLNSARSFETATEETNYFQQIAAEVAALPGVDAVGLIDATPLGRNRTWSVGAPGLTYEDGRGSFEIFPHIVDFGYLDTMGIDLLAGRTFTTADTEGAPDRIILNQTAARMVFNGEDALGRMMNCGRPDCEIVGIVADTRHVSLETEAGPQMYLPMTQRPDFGSLDLTVRSSLPADSLAGAVASAVHNIDPSMPATEYETLAHVVDRSMSARRFTLQVLVGFAFVALILAGMGIYSVLSYSVTERMREIGIRLALGETGAGLIRRVLGKTLTLAVIGLVVGTAGSIVVSRGLGSMLYDIQPTDPGTLTIMVVVLLGVAGLAGLLPALRAARTQAASVLWTT